MTHELHCIDPRRNVELPLLLQRVPSASDRAKRVTELLERVGLRSLVKHRPSELSGGQRAAIARALVTRPKLVLADEPTANLDSVTGENILDLMRELNQTDSTTFIFSTHDARVMAHASKVVRIADGRVAEAAQGDDAQCTTSSPAVPPARGESYKPARFARSRVVLEIAPESTAAPVSGPTASESRDRAVLGGVDHPMFTEEAAPADPLTIGGQLYLRLQCTALDHNALKDYGLSSPTLLDVFFDARPNDRVRGFVRGRMLLDPLQPATGAAISAATMSAGTSGSSTVTPLWSGATSSARVLLDQLWLRFDIAHALFVTAGRQHVRWGTGHFWTPTDFLHVSKRNPLDVFDTRTGTTMIKLHVPVESRAWNFYGYAVTDGENGQPTLSTPAGALRAEFTLDTLEVGLGVLARPRTRTQFVADVSMGLGDIDFYGELALVDARQSDRVRIGGDDAPPCLQQSTVGAGPQEQLDCLYPIYREVGYRPQGVVGMSYTGKYNDSDNFTVGAEYFYNGLGYDDLRAYYGLLLPHSVALRNPASSFYLGQHYAGLYISVPAPFKLDLHTFTLSTLGNLSDHSFTTRFDYAYMLLTHLRLEGYAAVLYGRLGGEFRLAFPTLEGLDLRAYGVPTYPAVFMLGFGLQLAM